LILVIFASILV